MEMSSRHAVLETELWLGQVDILQPGPEVFNDGDGPRCQLCSCVALQDNDLCTPAPAIIGHPRKQGIH